MQELASMRMGRVCNYLGIEYGDEVKKFMVESAGRGLPNFISYVMALSLPVFRSKQPMRNLPRLFA